MIRTSRIVACLASAFAYCNAHGDVEPSAFNLPDGHIYHDYNLVKPFFAGDGITMHNWAFYGNAVVTDDYVRLTPDRQTKKGAIWSKKPFAESSWEVTVNFNVNGQGKSLFGDGFALWYTQGRGTLGTALGNTEAVNGVGILFDTYDNHQEDHGHPWVSALVNDGSKVYNHDEDGKQVTMGGCQSFFRNLDHPTYVRATYWSNLKYLSVQTLVREGGEWEDCFDVDNLVLPAGYFFGASASTGDLADNHDILSIKIGTPPQPDDTVITKANAAIAEAAKTVGSLEAAKREQLRHHMDPQQLVSNHQREALRAQGQADEAEDEETSWGMIIVYVLIAGAIVGGIAYFALGMGGGSKKGRFDY